MRFVDQLIHRVIRPTGWNPVLVNIGNVATYYWEEINQDVFDWQGDFPNIAPPWPEAVYIMRLPKMVLSRVGMQRVNVQDDLAVTAFSWDLSHPSGVESAMRFLRDGNAQIEGVSWSQARWAMVLTLYCGRRFPDPSLSMLVLVAGDGHYMDISSNYKYLFLHFGEDRSSDFMRQFGQVMFEPVMLAVSFLHCKNTTVHDVVPPPKLAKRALERSGVPMNTYKVLDISPMTKIMGSAAGKGASLVKRLHICRGHFKDYREHGLFGKEHGLFWWSQHVRGAKTAGTVMKEYSVRSSVVSSPNVDIRCGR